MSQERVDPGVELAFTGRYAEQKQVPAAVLMQALGGLQRAIHLLAMEQEKVEVRQRERVSAAIERKYPLLCGPLEPGSVRVAARIGDPTSDLFAPDDISAVADKLREVLQALRTGARSLLSEHVPDRTRRLRLLEAFRSMLPRRGTGVALELRVTEQELAVCSEELQASLPEMLRVAEVEEELRTVTGRLSRIDFDDRKLTIIYPPTLRELECIYDETVEGLLLASPRELIQVTGRVILDDEDQPKRIIDVQSIRELDLSAFFLSELVFPDCTLRFHAGRSLLPELDESRQLLCLRDAELGIDVCAPTREELFEELCADVDVLWRNYACAPDEALDPVARQLKRRILDAAEEVTHAAR